MKLFVTALTALLVFGTTSGSVSTARADDPPGAGTDDKPARPAGTATPGTDDAPGEEAADEPGTPGENAPAAPAAPSPAPAPRTKARMATNPRPHPARAHVEEDEGDGRLEKKEDTVLGGRHFRINTSRGAVHVWAPPDYDRATAGTVIYVHGYYTDADGAWREHELAKQFKASHQNALFIVPDAPAGNDDDVKWPALKDLMIAAATM